jgi:hypothetical protein
MNRLARLFWIVLVTVLVAFANALTATASLSPGYGSAVFFKGPVSSIGMETDERPVASSPLCICHVYGADRLYGPTHFAWSVTAQRPASEDLRRWMFLGGPARADRLRYDENQLLRVSHAGFATKPAAATSARAKVTETMGTPVRSTDAVAEWEVFLGPGPHSSIHPRTGLPDPDRIVSADGLRSIRMGSHEMRDPNNFHYHEETWNAMKTEVQNVVRPVQRVKKAK